MLKKYILFFSMFILLSSCMKKLMPTYPISKNNSSINSSSGNNEFEEEVPNWFLEDEEQQRPKLLDSQVLFHSSVDKSGNPTSIYRIPAITVSEKNTIIAVADSRKGSYEDVGFNNSKDIDIVVRRSTDGGHTFGGEIIIPPKSISKDDAHGDSLFFSCKNGDLVVLCSAGGGYAQQTKKYSKVMISRSTDDGVTWSEWKDADGDVNNFGSGLLQPYKRGFAASGTGVRLEDGTLMGAMLVNSGTDATKAAAAVIVSMDNGYTWHVRSIAKRKSGTQDEPKVVAQLNDGRILMSVRSGPWNASSKKRIWFRSQSGIGSNWDEITASVKGNFNDAACNAEGIMYSSTKYGYEKNRLIHVALNSDNGRKNLTAFISYDEGKSWEVGRVLNSSKAGYTSLARLKDGTIVVLSEEGNGTNPNKEHYDIVFRRFNLAWLTDGKDVYNPPNKY